MGIALAKQTIEQYFIDSWVLTPIQFDGTEIDVSTNDDWISLKYVPVKNSNYGMDGTLRGRTKYNGQLQVFCYAKNVPLTYTLADSVLEFLSSRVLASDINVDIGQAQGNAIDTDNNFYEMLVTFEVNNYE